jgi:acyl-CoA synthetase (AMP-forming)/AMP-acid ligase II
LRHDEHLTRGARNDAARLVSCGREVTGVWVDVIDTDGRSVTAGERGEIIVRGPGVMAGYWRNETATDAAIKNGWLHSGDVGTRDADGYVTIVDRLKDVIITGGSNVYPKEVELVLEAVPGVSEVAVVGVEDAIWGEVVTAMVVCEAGRHVSEETLLTTCHSELAPYKQPRTVRFADALPRNTLGKIDKVRVREEMSGRPEHAPTR